jgi:hypothetical protein
MKKRIHSRGQTLAARLASRALTPAVMLLATLPAEAGRPLSTEDASILEAKHCQLESWIDRSREATEAWAVPACNFGAGIEWQLGGVRTFADGGHAFSGAYAQAKAAFVSVEDHPWGIGLVAGVLRFPQREAKNGWADPYVIVPVSFQLGGDGALLHLNAGSVRDRAEKRNLTLWGVAAEAPLGRSGLTVLGEAYGENSRNPFFRVGARWTVIENRLDLDLSAVARSGGTRAERFLSLGLYYKSDAFLP